MLRPLTLAREFYPHSCTSLYVWNFTRLWIHHDFFESVSFISIPEDCMICGIVHDDELLCPQGLMEHHLESCELQNV